METKEINSFFGEYRFLSNFYPVKITFEGKEYRSTEAAYQAAKTLDENIREALSNSPPNLAKQIGKSLQLRPDWEEVKLEVMAKLLYEKFTQEPFKSKLIETYPKKLVEGNTWGDVFWGVCNGVGQNNLGKLLMELREILKENK